MALALVLLLHALFALVLWYVMQPKPPCLAVVTPGSDPMLIVRLIDQPASRPAAQPPAPPMPPPRPAATMRARPVTHEKSHRDAMVVQDHEAARARTAPAAMSAAINLFAKDGSVRLPPTTPDLPAATSAAVKPAKPADDRQIMQHDRNRMHYKATRFEKYFPPPDETAGGAVGRHMGNVIKALAKSLCDPGKANAASNALCSAPPPPPSPKDADERLNLPPPSLTDDPHPDIALPLSTCIAEYKADKPLSYGCPVNTPDLAFKAEMRICIDLFRAGKRLKTWCPLDTPKRAAAESPPVSSSSVGTH